MLEKISKSDIADLRAVLNDAQYIERHLEETLGSAAPPTAASLPLMLYRTRQPTALNALVRLFLAGASLETGAAGEVLPQLFVDMCLHTGLLERYNDRIHASITIVPIDNLLFASDAFRKVGNATASEFVLPASTLASSYLRRLTMRDPVETTLDLGCGCGVHALLAARHSKHVLATDISQSAIDYTEFNVVLNNIDNVQCLHGSLFEPVAGRTFDRIISNPPFVIGPANQFTYRDNPLELDDFCRLLVKEAPSYLNDRGCLQMLCEWVEIDGQPWQERLSAWVEDTSCDTWILRNPPRDPVSYVTQRRSDIAGEGVEPGATFDDWLAYFEERRVKAIHPGMLLLRRRDDVNWFRIHGLESEPDEDIGESIERNMLANDFLQLCDDDETILEAVLAVSPDLELEQKFLRDDNSWASDSAMLRLTGGLPMETEVDLPILAFFNQLDGRKPLRECIGAFCTATGAHSEALTPQLLPVVRLFIGNGLIEAVEPA